MTRTPDSHTTVSDQRATLLIFGGFAAVLALMFIVLGVGLVRIQAITHSLNEIVEQHNVHSELAFRMHTAARERSLLLYRITHEPDAFERDAQVQRFTELAAEFGSARRQLLTMPLTNTEQALLKQQGDLTALAVQQQLEIIDLANSGRHTAAHRFLVERAIPAQDKVLAVLSEFLQLQLQESGAAAATARTQRAKAVITLSMTVALAALMTISIAVFVRRRLSELINRLTASSADLRQSLHEIEHIKSAIDHHAIVSIADVSGNITYVNNKFCAISGYLREELLGQNHRLLKSGYHPQTFFDELWHTITEGRVWQGEIRNRAKNGTHYWVATTIMPLLDDSGLPYQYISIRTDISVMKESEMMLRQNQQHLEMLVQERTAELAQANQHLHTEIEDRARTNVLLSERAEQLQESKEILSSITSAARDGIVMIDNNGCVTFWNQAATTLFGYDSGEVIGRDIHALLMPERYRVQQEPAFAHFRATGQGIYIGRTAELEALHKDGHEIPVELSLSAVKMRGQWHGVGVLRDITDRRQAQQELVRQATVDALTGALNRRKFSDLMEHEIARSARYRQPLALILFDIDHFKRINDSAGHDAGDAVLREIAQCVTRVIRTCDVFARWGGEEFMVMLPNTDADGARALAEKLRITIAQQAYPQIGTVTCSFGVTECRSGDASDGFVKRADVALYQAKSNGRNRTVVI